MPRVKRRKFTRQRRSKSAKKDLKRRLRLISLAFIVFISTVSLFGIVYFWQFWQMKRSFAFSLPSLNQRKNLNFVLALVSDLDSSDSRITSLKLVHLDKQEKKMLIFSLPLDVKVDVYPSFGFYKLSKAYALAGFAGAENRLESLSKTIGRFLSLKIDGIIVAEGDNKSDAANALSRFSFWPKILLQKKIRTNISLFQLWKIGLNFKKEELNFSQKSYSKYFYDEEITQEGKKVLVLNSTDIPGLAGKASRYLENLGISVLGVGNYEDDYRNDQSLIITNDKKSRALLTIASILEINKVADFKNFSAPSFYKRADIVVILGLDKKDFF